MFTVEMDTAEGESSTITTLDETGTFPDVEVNIFDDMVVIRQIKDVEKDIVLDMVVISPEQWSDILAAMQMPAGVYKKELV
jgi:hypothetical protein